MISRIRFVSVTVTDIDLALDFYLNKLGFQVRVEMPLPAGNRFVMVVPPEGGASLVFSLPLPGWFNQQNAAAAAKDAGIAGKEKAKNEAKAAIDAATAALTSASDLFATVEKCPRAKRAKEVKKDLETVKGNLEGMKTQAADLAAKFSKEDFFGAKAAADTLKGAVAPIAADLEGIKTKFKCK